MISVWKSFKNQNIPLVIAHENCFFEIGDFNASSVRCPGVCFDKNLLMQNHITGTYLKKYFYCQLHYLYSVKKCLSTSVKLKLVKGVILSKIEFRNAVFINLPKYQILKIHKIIHSSLGYIYSLSIVSCDTSISLYYLKAHILPFKYCLKYKACLTVFKCVHDIAPMYPTNLIHPYLFKIY